MTKHPHNRLERIKAREEHEKSISKSAAGKVRRLIKESLKNQETEDELVAAKRGVNEVKRRGYLHVEAAGE